MCKNEIKIFHGEEPGYPKAKWKKRSWSWEEMKEGLCVWCQRVMAGDGIGGKTSLEMKT